MSIATFYRGKISFADLIDMPIDYIHTLEYLAQKHRDDQAQQRQAEALEEEIQNVK